MAASDKPSDESLYPIAVLIDELKNEDIQVSVLPLFHLVYIRYCFLLATIKANEYGDTVLVIIIHIFIVKRCSRISQLSMTHTRETIAKKYAYIEQTQNLTVCNLFAFVCLCRN